MQRLVMLPPGAPPAALAALRAAVLRLNTDSVFAEMHLISCRNVLIYFDRALQSRAVSLLYDSLCRRGFLGLGSKETLRFSERADGFREFVAECRIYQRL